MERLDAGFRHATRLVVFVCCQYQMGRCGKCIFLLVRAYQTAVVCKCLGIFEAEARDAVSRFPRDVIGVGE